MNHNGNNNKIMLTIPIIQVSKFSATSVSPANLHSICFSTIIFTITRGWQNMPGVAAVPIASQTKLKKKV
jgi:hypothetical protein